MTPLIPDNGGVPVRPTHPMGLQPAAPGRTSDGPNRARLPVHNPASLAAVPSYSPFHGLLVTI